MSLKKIVSAVYSSGFSKKIGVYRNPLILKTFHQCRSYHSRKMTKGVVSLFQTQKLDESAISSLTYNDIYPIIHYDVESYKKILTHVCDCNLKRLSAVASDRKIRVAFYLYAAGLWSCDRLYRYFENDERFEPVVVVTRFTNGTPQTTLDEYNNSLKYFVDRGFRTIGVSDEKYAGKGWKEVVNPDIVILLTPYQGANPESFSNLNIPLSTLCLHIMYGLSSVGADWVYDTIGDQISWKTIVENNILKKIREEKAQLGIFNVLVAGHPKMDTLLQPEKAYNPGVIWKNTGTSVSKVKKIIYAPHHSIFDTTIQFSTFHLNYRQIFEYAKNHPDTTSWIVKPHQNLRKQSVQSGLFKSVEEYDAYMDGWDALPNARTVRSGTYEDLFLTSDAIVMDCGSFLSEYHLVNKPIIYLRRPEQVFNECGTELIKTAYSVSGSDISAIYKTIDDVILGGNDYLAEKRFQLLNERIAMYDDLDGVSSSSEYIYKYILKALKFNN